MEHALSNCELRVELPASSPSSESSDGNDHEVIPHLTRTAQHLFSSNTEDVETLSSFAQSIHLHQFNGNAVQRCPLIAIPIPASIVSDIDEQEYQSTIRKTEEHPRSTSEILNRILPTLHPSLTQLTPCGLIRTLPKIMVNTFHLILIRVPGEFNSASEGEGEAILNTIIEEINGLAMVGAPSATIQIIPILGLTFYAAGSVATQNAQAMLGYKLDATSTPTNTSEVQISSNKPGEIPLCPVCRFRIIPERLGLAPLSPSQLCSYHCDCDFNGHGTSFCDNMQFLSQWSYPTYCHACHVLQDRLIQTGAVAFPCTNSSIERIANVNRNASGDDHNERSQIKCWTCGMEETLWVCLTCGVMGCGWYSNGHAERHFLETNHPFSLELATQRIWDYETSSFVQRDDLLNCPWMQKFLGAINRAAYQGASFYEDSSNGEEHISLPAGKLLHLGDGKAPKKAMTVGEEYEALLQSSLEDQSQYYEGKIAHLRADLTGQSIDREIISDEEKIQMRALELDIEKLQEDVEKQSKMLLEVQRQEAGHKAKYKTMLREQSICKDLLQRIKDESTHERELGKQDVEDMQQQISDLTANLRMRQQIAQSQELSNAQIFGTSGEVKPSKKKGFRKKRK